jgi:hypothetical protein
MAADRGDIHSACWRRCHSGFSRKEFCLRARLHAASRPNAGKGFKVHRRTREAYADRSLRLTPNPLGHSVIGRDRFGSFNH